MILVRVKEFITNFVDAGFYNSSVFYDTNTRLLRLYLTSMIEDTNDSSSQKPILVLFIIYYTLITIILYYSVRYLA